MSHPIITERQMPQPAGLGPAHARWRFGEGEQLKLPAARHLKIQFPRIALRPMRLMQDRAAQNLGIKRL